jgi:periplasmic protein TonB
VTVPRLLSQVGPQYTAAAMRARKQGTIVLAAVVLVDGRPGNIKVVRSLDAEDGLDREAVKALEQWRFAPGTADGRPVPVMITVECTFSLGPR